MNITDRRGTRFARPEDGLTVPCARCPRRVLTSSAMRLTVAPAGVDRKAAEYLCPPCSKSFTAGWYRQQREAVTMEKQAGSVHPIVLMLAIMGAAVMAFALTMADTDHAPTATAHAVTVSVPVGATAPQSAQVAPTTTTTAQAPVAAPAATPTTTVAPAPVAVAAPVAPSTIEHLTVDGGYPMTTDYGSLYNTAASLPPYVNTVIPDTTDQSGNGTSTAISDYGAGAPQS